MYKIVYIIFDTRSFIPSIIPFRLGTKSFFDFLFLQIVLFLKKKILFENNEKKHKITIVKIKGLKRKYDSIYLFY